MKTPFGPIVDMTSGTWVNPSPASDLVDLANNTLGAVLIPLKVPFSFRGVAYESVPLRVPTGRDARAFFWLPSHEQTPYAWLT